MSQTVRVSLKRKKKTSDGILFIILFKVSPDYSRQPFKLPVVSEGFSADDFRFTATWRS